MDRRTFMGVAAASLVAVPLAQAQARTGTARIGGGLMGYHVNQEAMYRRAAYFIDRILNGAKPSDLPIEQPTAFELVLNRKSAQALGVAFPPSLLVSADRLIE